MNGSGRNDETNPLLQPHHRRTGRSSSPRTLYEAIAPEDFETEAGLAKIQAILDSIEAAEEQHLPSLGGSVPSCGTSAVSSSVRRLVQQKQQSWRQRHASGTSNRKMTTTGVVIGAAFGVSLVVTTIVILSAARLIVPTPGERAVWQHYYGNGGGNDHYNVDESMRRIREAQDEADAAFAARSSRRYLEDRRLRRGGRQQETTLSTPLSYKMDDDYSYDNTGDATSDHKNADDNLYEGCESTILLLRHCEKSAVAEHCAYDGFERSYYLSTLFGDRWPIPYEIYAEHPAERKNPDKQNFREVETVGPTARKFDLPIDSSYSEVRSLAHSIWNHVESGNLCGRLVIVAWKHTDIPQLGRLLGCGPMQGCPYDYHGKTFDDAWQVKFVYQRWPHSENKHHFDNADDIEESPPSWRVFGSVQPERFDPLAVSYRAGGYRGPDGRPPSWRDNVTDIPERRSRHDQHVKYDEAKIWLEQVDP
jgi:hypothetical protein